MKPRKSRPEDLPNQCEWDGCPDPVDYEVVFSDPTDYVYYCEYHAGLWEQDPAFESMQAL